MPFPWMAAAMVGSSLLNAWGQSRGGRAQAQVPRDLGPLRGQTLQMLQGFLSNPNSAMDFFMGQGGGGANAFLNSAPETSAYNQSRDALTAMLTGGGPQFERDIAMGKSAGGRFSSGNAIMQGEAYRHLFNNRTQAAGVLGNVQNQRFNQFQGLDAQRLALLSGLFGMAGQGTLGLPITERPNAASVFGGAGMDIAQMLMLMQGARGGNTPNTPWRPPTVDTQGGTWGIPSSLFPSP
jgi:hypothetical protein